MTEAIQLDGVAQLVEYLTKTRHLSQDEQIKGIYGHCPDITPDKYVAAVKIFHAREFADQKTAKPRLPEILSRLKNKSGYMTKATFLGVSWKKVDGAWCGRASWSL